jgi:hypothetical protein
MVPFQVLWQNNKLFQFYKNRWYIALTFTNIFLFRKFFCRT